MRFLFTCAYDGVPYLGWQSQRGGNTVQDTIEEAMAAVLKTPLRIAAAGRTDAGVHALRYCANFKAETNIPADRIPLAVNSRLPADIAVTAACDVDDDFNADI